MKIYSFLQSRLNSTRLPCKALLPLGNKTILERCLESSVNAKTITKTILVTSNIDQDDIIAEIGNKVGVKVFRGPLNNVYQRYKMAKDFFNPDVVVRLTGDNPCIDPSYIDQIVEEFISSDCDYLSNKLARKAPIGLDVEIFKASLLDKDPENVSDQVKEHVTMEYYNPENEYHIEASKIIEEDLSKFSVTIDTIEDYLRVLKIFKNVFRDNKFEYSQLINFLKNEDYRVF